MKKILSATLLLCAALGFTGCAGEEDDLFDKSAAERLNEASDLYSARLEAQPNGWAMQLYPTKQNEAPYGSGYLVLLRFNSDNSVYAAMNNSLSGNSFIEDTSAWQIVTDMGPVLSFNSHNDVIHVFSDPNDVPSTSDSESGTGIGGDYEFVIVDAPEDASYMMLKGKKRGTYNLLTPVEEGVVYSDYLVDVNAFMAKMFSQTSPTFDVVHYGDSIYKMEDAYDGIPNIYPYDQDAVLNEDFNPFLITKLGDDYYLRFRDSKTYNDVSVQNFKYDTEKDQFISTDNEAYYIEGDEPARYFEASVAADSTWSFNRGTAKSDDFQTLYDNVRKEFNKWKEGNRAAQLTKLAITGDGNGNMNIQAIYQVGQASRNPANFKYTYTKDGDKFNLQYVEADNGGQKVLSKVPSMQEMLNALSKQFVVTKNETRFNLSKLKLVSATDENSWFVISL